MPCPGVHRVYIYGYNFVLNVELSITELALTVQDFTTSLAPMTLSSTEGGELLLQPIVHHSLMHILSTIFEALSSNELVHYVTYWLPSVSLRVEQPSWQYKCDNNMVVIVA